MTVQKMVMCEVYESKPSLYYSDDNFYLNKIGSFVSSDYDINIGTLASTSNGSVTAPSHLALSQPIKIGDILNVTLVNYERTGLQVVARGYAIDLPGVHESVMDDRSYFQHAFVISAMDGNRLVLADYNEYNHSYVTVGYVGMVDNEPTLDVISMLSRRDMRAFSCKLYPFGDKENGVRGFTPFMYNGSDNFWKTLSTSFSDDFTKTNVKPYDVITRAIKNSYSYTDDNKRKTQTLTMGAVVKHDGRGYYVFSYIYNGVDGRPPRHSVRTKPGSNIQLQPSHNNAAATIWIQPQDNGDDYVRAGVVIATATESGVTYKTIGQVTESDYTGYGLTTLQTVLVGYGQLVDLTHDNPIQKAKMDEQAPDKTTYSNEAQYNADKTAWDAKKAQVDAQNQQAEDFEKAFKDKVKEALGEPINPQTAKELLTDALTDKPGEVVELAGVQVDWLGIVRKNLWRAMVNSLKASYTPVQIVLGESDFYGNATFSGDELITLYHTNRFGASVVGANASVVQTNYTPNGRKYTIETLPWYGYDPELGDFAPKPLIR
nr:MAG TPA: hypothetical protein [Caudoviricetes sp.]